MGERGGHRAENGRHRLAIMVKTNMTKYLVLKDTRAVGLYEKAWNPNGLVWEELVRT